jgi:hypothetical protein
MVAEPPHPLGEPSVPDPGQAASERI